MSTNNRANRKHKVKHGKNKRHQPGNMLMYRQNLDALLARAGINSQMAPISPMRAIGKMFMDKFGRKTDADEPQRG